MSARAPPPATRPARSLARGSPSTTSGAIGSPPSAPSPLSNGTRITRPAGPAPRRGTAAAATGAPALSRRSSSPRDSSENRPRSADSPERPTSRSSFYASLARETEEKEALMVKLQEREATIASLNAANTTLHSAMTDAESRLTELYEEQSRMEDELASRNVVTEKLRNEVRDLEKEDRELRKRYHDQTQSFDAERQAFYDSEQHLKSRIQSLMQARTADRLRRKSMALLSESSTQQSIPEAEDAESEVDETEAVTAAQAAEQADEDDEDETEPPEMMALRVELSTLTTSHTSMQNTLQLLQNQLQDLKRVNKELQEENEGYNTLLVERTMAGQFDIRRSAPGSATWPSSAAPDDDTASLHGTVRSTRLDPVHELGEDEQLVAIPLDMELSQAFSSTSEPRSPSPSSTRTGGRRTSRRAGSTRTASPKGENLGELPVAGPGLDLAAELGRAESKDLVHGFMEDPSRAKSSLEVVDEKELEALRSENKQLREANKALSLYSSKILDKIIGHGGFEYVLAADGEEVSAPPNPRTVAPAPPKEKRPRPQSMSFLRSLGGGSSTPSTPNPAIPSTPALHSTPAVPDNTPVSNVKSDDTPTSKRSRRGLSMDWSKLSIWASPFSGNESPAPMQSPPQPIPAPALSASTNNNARKLDVEEDEEDRVIRARLNAEMRLHGIEKEDTPNPLGPPSIKSSSASVRSTDSAPTPVETAPAPTPPTSLKARLPFFSRTSSSNSPSTSNVPLTTETLQQAEAEASIAAHDAKEKQLADEMAKDPSGVRVTSFTEMPGLGLRPGSSLSERARERRRKSEGRSGAGSDGSASVHSVHSVKSGASTLFSAGRMSMEGGLGEHVGEDDA